MLRRAGKIGEFANVFVNEKQVSLFSAPVLLLQCARHSRFILNGIMLQFSI